MTLRSLIAVAAFVVASPALALSLAGLQRPASQLSVEPPDVAKELGLVPTPLPERWIEAAAAGATREYYEDILEYGSDDTAVRGQLVLEGDASGKPLRFTLTEYHLRIPSGQPSTLTRTSSSSGRVSVEQAKDDTGAVTIYRLVSEKPSRTWIFVKDPTRLALATITNGRVSRTGRFGQTLVAVASPQSVSLTGEADAAMKWKVRLRAGQQLDVKLAPMSASRQWELRTGGQIGPLSVRAGSTAPVKDASQIDGRIQVFRFTAASPGWNDLRFEHGIIKTTVRAKVE